MKKVGRVTDPRGRVAGVLPSVRNRFKAAGTRKVLGGERGPEGVTSELGSLVQ